MKTMSGPLLSYLNAFRPTSDVSLLTADLFTITLQGGTVLTYATEDYPVAWNGYTYQNNSVMVSGLKYKASTGLNVDKQAIMIYARPTDTVGGIPFLQALWQGLLDGAFIQRERAFFTSLAGNYPLTPLGTVILFKGRVSEIHSIGRTSAEVEVSSDLVLLDINMPRNIYQPNCNHVFCDTGCTLSKASFTTTGNCGAGSTQTTILWSGSLALHQQGTVTFTSGQNTAIEATVKTAVAGVSLTLSYPLTHVPATGDSFSAVQGCDHTSTRCSALSNIANYRGFPFVPPPQVVTGNMSNTYTQGK